MLMLTRRQNQKVLFPHLGITVEVVEVSGKTVRMGIDAPREIKILREELYDQEADSEVEALIGHLDDPIKEQLDSTNLAIHLAQNQLKSGLTEYATGALQNALDCLSSLEDCVRHELQRLENLQKQKPKEVGELVVRESSTSYSTDPLNANALARDEIRLSHRQLKSIASLLVA